MLGHPPPSPADHPLVKTSKRHRRLLEQAIFPEIAAVKAAQDAITPQEIKDFISTIFEHEVGIAIAADNATTGNLVRHGNAPLPKSYNEDYIKSFLDTVRLYAHQASNYADAVEISNEFQKDLPPHLRSHLSTGKRPLNDQLIELNQNGSPAVLMGAINAHHFIPHILQLYCGLYSHDMRDIPRPLASGFGDDKIPNPNIGAFQRRQNIRLAEADNDVAEADEADNDVTFDPALGGARYIDLLTAKRPDAVWTSKSRTFYEQGIFRMPGLKQADKVFDSIKSNHNGHAGTALRYLWQKAQHSMMQAKQEPSDLRKAQHDESRFRYQMALLEHPTGCLMNQQGGYIYIGSELADMLIFKRIPNVYPPAVLDFNWKTEVEDKWRAADATIAARPKTPPKMTRAIYEARVTAAMRLAEKIDAELAAAKMALDTYDQDQAAKAAKAAQRRAAAEQKARQEAAERQANLERIKDAEKKAEKTRKEKRAAARAMAARRKQEWEERQNNQQAAQAKARERKLADQSRPPLTEAERRERIERNKARERKKREDQKAARKAWRNILLDVRTFKNGKPTRKSLRHKQMPSPKPE